MTEDIKKNKISRPKKILFFVVIYGIIFIFADILFALVLIPSVEGVHHPYYHHDMKTNRKMLAKWGAAETWIYTNSLAFKDREIREVPLTSSNERILLMGDSFVEGVGYPFEKTFAGMFTEAMGKHDPKIEVWNAGCRSYSPKLYYLKTKYLLKEVGFKFNEMIVFIDISDIQDEIKYKDFSPKKKLSFSRKLDSFLDKKSYCFNQARRLFFNKETLYATKDFFACSANKTEIKDKKENDIVVETSSNQFNINDFYKNYYEERPKWTFDDAIYNKWGKEGLNLAKEHMQKLVDLCKANNIEITIAVYPWPEQIKKGNLACKQVTVWKEFAAGNKIGFINYFPLFINETSADEIIKENFIKGDDHWNEKGHKIIADLLLKIRSIK
jgi:hypothetical protein